MKKLLLIIPLVFLLCFTFSCQKGEERVEEPTVDVEADIAALETKIKQVMDAWNEGDLDAVMATIAEDAIFMPPGEPALIGKEVIRNWYNFDDYSHDITISVDENEIHGDWAFQRTRWKGALIEKDSGESAQMESKGILISKKQLDGSWKTTHSIWNFTVWHLDRN